METLSRIEIFEWLHRMPLACDFLLMKYPVHLWQEDAEVRVEMRERFDFDCDCDFAVEVKVLFKQEEEPTQKIAQLLTLGFRWSMGFHAATRTLENLEELFQFLKLFVTGWRKSGVLPACLTLEPPAAETWPALPLAA